MKHLTAKVLVLGFALGLSAPAQSAEPLVVYDNFDGPGINPELWDARRIEPTVLDVAREVTKLGKLRLFVRGYGDTSSTGGRNTQTLRLWFKRSNDLTSMESWTRVRSVSALGCLDDTGTSSLISYRLSGYWFKSRFAPEDPENPDDPNDATGDVFASLELRRDSNYIAPDGEMQIIATIHHCVDFDCDNSISVFSDSDSFGTALADRRIRLLLEYDAHTNTFIFQRDFRAPIAVVLDMSDFPNHGPPADASHAKRIELRSNVESCEVAPRPVVDMDVRVLLVRTNEGALP